MSNYLAIPVWEHNRWIPTSLISDDPAYWPEGFDPESLPKPPHNIGQEVSFRWSKGVILRGKISRIRLGGGSYMSCEKLEDVIAERYSLDRLTYIVYANGHGRQVYAKDVI